MDNNLLAIIAIILIALVFDFYNGANDAANSISTIVATKVLKPIPAVIWAAFFNFISFFIVGTAVATTIGSGIIEPNIVDNSLIAASLTGGALWTIICTHTGLPISASHALIGGLVGSAIVKAGTSVIIKSGIYKTLLFIILSPILGLIIGIFIMILFLNIFKKSNPYRLENFFRKGQLFSSALYAMGHGGNDAQKTAGIVSLLLYANGYLGDKFYIPFWVVLMSFTTIALGTLLGGWKVVNMMGQRLTKLRPIDGFAAELGAAITLHAVTMFGIPVSTTHTITGSIAGVGSVKRLHSVRWGVSKSIVWAWILTIPGAALISAITYYIISLIF
ncbi:MAG: inorganic phosphate transporter [Elusimicrobiales bacterium]|nr:inorganic phosphate transporter [Elusimicrobiales bacterium]